MKKLICTLMVLCVLSASSLCSAGGIQDTIGEDKIAHAAVSYVICDQLKRNAGMNDFWAAFTTLCIGAIKEGFIDDHWDGGDFAADCAGVAFYQVKF
jgi:hypothetical protein